MHFGWPDKRLFAWALKRWLWRCGPFDVVVANLAFASEVVHLAGIDHAWQHVHTTPSAEIRGLVVGGERKARRRLNRYRRIFEGRNVIAVSEGVASDLREELGLSRSRIVTIYNPHDFDEIRSLAAAPEPDVPRRPYVVHAGRYVKGKRHDLLLDAMVSSGIPHDLILMTDESEGLRRLIEARGLSQRVSVAGFRTNPFPWYAQASALILSSDHEGLPNVLIEALAVGTPVVSTDCRSGPNEILQGPLRSLLSPVGDADALGRNIRNVVESPPRIDAVLLEKFEAKRVIERFERVFSGASLD